MGFQFLGIPPKGEHVKAKSNIVEVLKKFPISRDPPEGGTIEAYFSKMLIQRSFQFLGIPPKGEHIRPTLTRSDSA